MTSTFLSVSTRFSPCSWVQSGRLLSSVYSHFVHPQIQPSNIYVDAVSMSLLKGSVIDFATELIGSSFRVLDNPQVSPVAAIVHLFLP